MVACTNKDARCFIGHISVYIIESEYIFNKLLGTVVLSTLWAELHSRSYRIDRRRGNRCRSMKPHVHMPRLADRTTAGSSFSDIRIRTGDYIVSIVCVCC